MNLCCIKIDNDRILHFLKTLEVVLLNMITQWVNSLSFVFPRPFIKNFCEGSSGVTVIWNLFCVKYEWLFMFKWEEQCDQTKLH